MLIFGEIFKCIQFGRQNFRHNRVLYWPLALNLGCECSENRHMDRCLKYYIYVFFLFCSFSIFGEEKPNFAEMTNKQIEEYQGPFFFYDPSSNKAPEIGDFIQYDSNYTYDSFFQNHIPHLRDPYKGVTFNEELTYETLGSRTGTLPGERCHPLKNDQYEEYGSGLKLALPLFGTDVVNEDTTCGMETFCLTSEESTGLSNLDDLIVPSICPFEIRCPQGIISPHDKCTADHGEGAEQCLNAWDSCYQMRHCINPRMNESTASANIETCRHDYNCASGYCQVLTTEMLRVIGEAAGIENPLPEPNKAICLPYASCQRECLKQDEILNTGDYCCAGLKAVESDDGNKYCQSAVVLMEEIPARIDMVVNSETDCSVVMNEINEEGEIVYEGSCDVHGVTTESDCRLKNGKWHPGNAAFIINEKKNMFNRYFQGLRWLWSEANISSEMGDSFSTNYQAKNLKTDINTFLSQADFIMYRAFEDIKAQQKELLENNGSGDISGVFDMESKSYIASEEASSSRVMRDGFLRLIGVDLNRINELAFSGTSIPDYLKPIDEHSTLVNYRNLAISPPAGYDKKGLCRRGHKNFKCYNTLIELLPSNAITKVGVVKNIVDPIAPESLVKFTQESRSNFDFSNKPDLLNEKILETFSNYANYLEVDTERQYESDEGNLVHPEFHRISSSVTELEIGSILKSQNSNLSNVDLSIFVSKLSNQVKRNITQQMISDYMQLHLEKFHEAVSYWETKSSDCILFGLAWCLTIETFPRVKYHKTSKATHLNRMILMAGYLARYYAASAVALEQQSQCFETKANEFSQSLGDSGASRVFIDTSNKAETVGAKAELRQVQQAFGEVNSPINTMGNLSDTSSQISSDNVNQKKSVKKSNKSKNASISDKAALKKLNAVFAAKNKNKNNILKKISDKPLDKKKFSPTQNLMSEFKKAYPPMTSLKKALQKNGLSFLDQGVKTAAISQKIDPEEDLGNVNALEKQKELNDSSSPVVNYDYSYGSGVNKRNSYKNKIFTPTKEQLDFLNSINLNRRKIKKREPASIWEKLSKTYLLTSPKRLFESK